MRDDVLATLETFQQQALVQGGPLRPLDDVASAVVEPAPEPPPVSPVPYDRPNSPLYRQEQIDQAARRLVDEGGLPPATYCGIDLWRAMRALVSEQLVAHAQVDADA